MQRQQPRAGLSQEKPLFCSWIATISKLHVLLIVAIHNSAFILLGGPHLVGHSNMQSNIKQKFLLSHENPDIPPSQRVMMETPWNCNIMLRLDEEIWISEQG